MFTIEEIASVMGKAEFIEDMNSVRQSLVNNRLFQSVLLREGSEKRLSHFVSAVVASSSQWERYSRFEICKASAEIAEVLSVKAENVMGRQLMQIRSAILYELAEQPSLAMAVLRDEGFPKFLTSFFRREGIFSLMGCKDRIEEGISGDVELAYFALLDDVKSYSTALENEDPQALKNGFVSVSTAASRVAASFDIGLDAAEVKAFAELIRERMNRATISKVDKNLFPLLRNMGFPAELLPAQRDAVEGGLLRKDLSWGFAAPTGSGKTFLSRLLIADILSESEGSKVIYLVPSKALVSEVSVSLGKAFFNLGHKVIALSAQLVSLDEGEGRGVDEASVIVMTPEKADMLLRVGAEFLSEVSLVVVDEAHHIESGTRGALLEFYLWRMKKVLAGKCRYVFLSAVAPNITDMARWMEPGAEAVVCQNRPTRMRVGIYRIKGSGKKASGVVEYTDGTSTAVAAEGAETNVRKGICELSFFLGAAGPVLVVAKGKKECENIAAEMRIWLKKSGSIEELSKDQIGTDIFQSLDASLEREMYSDVELRALIRHGIAYHHAGLPPSVRLGVEDAIRKGLIKYVFATTTLAEGVNFPFSSVVVQSLAFREPPEKGVAARYIPVTPRTFWNIAGRAGRPGYDVEGQVVLFERSLSLDKINAVIDPYLKPGLNSLSPVTSALASALQEIQEELRSESYPIDQLSEVRLPEKMSRRAKGAVNLLRVGLMHARAAGLKDSPEEILEGTFASTFMSKDQLAFCKAVARSQDDVINKYLASYGDMDIGVMAELGLSLETLSELRQYVSQLEDWQIEGFIHLFYGGDLNLGQAQYIVGPVAKRMSELDGPNLGGFLSDVIVKWVSGITFTSIRSESNFSKRLEDLISVIYSRVQFLLPWGLWATDALIAREAEKRGLNYEGQVKKLAYLADAGVPNFDALGLFHSGFERVDATRLSLAYRHAGGVGLGVDCFGWINSQPQEALRRIVSGRDGRRLEHRFFDRVRSADSGNS